MAPSGQSARSSLEASEHWIEESQKTLRAEALSASVNSSYIAMFHAARAVLFRDGFREKSHYCIARYIEETYVKPGKLEAKWINLLDQARETRHQNQYDTRFTVTPGEAEGALSTARSFVSRIKSLLALDSIHS